MKKFLSLVLALVMTMSLVTVSAGAKDFADDSDIDYKAAVDVISELGVVNGYSDDTFRPDGLLTRGGRQDHLQPDPWPHHRQRAERQHRPLQGCAHHQRVRGLHHLLRAAGHHQRLR